MKDEHSNEATTDDFGKNGTKNVFSGSFVKFQKLPFLTLAGPFQALAGSCLPLDGPVQGVAGEFAESA